MAQSEEKRIKQTIKARTRHSVKSRIVYQGSNLPGEWDLEAQSESADARIGQLRQGIIWAEILGRPVSKRRGRGRFGM